jgi:hypothetical protein
VQVAQLLAGVGQVGGVQQVEQLVLDDLLALAAL